MKTVTDEIRQAIKKHLPEMEADELKKFIEHAQNDAESVERLTQQLRAKEDQVNTLLKQKTEFETAKKLLADAILNNQVAETKERTMAIETLKIQLAAEIKITNNMREFISLIAKNPRAIEIMQHCDNQVQPGYYNGNQFVTPPPIMKNETKITEMVEEKTSRPEPLV